MASGSEEKEPSERGHEKTLSSGSKSFGERFGLGYFRETLDWFTGKARKKEKSDGSGDGGGGTAADNESSKLYLNHVCLLHFPKNHQLRQIVPLPPEIELQEWLVSQIIPFFNHINLTYGIVSEFCTQTTCPVMAAPNNVVYLWTDEKGKKSKCSAPQYIDYVMASIEKLVRDDTVFPTKHGLPFPPNFDVVVRRILRQLLHVLAHIYHAHFDVHVQLGTHPYLNGLFAHFILFSQHFKLIEDRELDVLRDLIDKLLADSDVIMEAEVERKQPASSVELSDPVEQKAGELNCPVIPPSVMDEQKMPLVSLDNSKIICDKKSVDTPPRDSPLKIVESVAAPLNVRDLLMGNPSESTMI